MGKNSHLENTISIELSDSISSLNQIDEFEYLDEEEVNVESFKLIKQALKFLNGKIKALTNQEEKGEEKGQFTKNL